MCLNVICYEQCDPLCLRSVTQCWLFCQSMVWGLVEKSMYSCWYVEWSWSVSVLRSPICWCKTPTLSCVFRLPRFLACLCCGCCDFFSLFFRKIPVLLPVHFVFRHNPFSFFMVQKRCQSGFKNGPLNARQAFCYIPLFPSLLLLQGVFRERWWLHARLIPAISKICRTFVFCKHALQSAIMRQLESKYMAL